MSIYGGEGGPSMEQIRAALLSSDPPKSEGAVATQGVTQLAARDQHQHERITCAGYGTLNSSGLSGNITFMRGGVPASFAARPSPVLTAVATSKTQPTILEVATWIQDGSNNYTGCTVKGYLGQTVPQNLATLLLGGIYNLFAANPNGIEFSYVMVPTS